MPWFGEPWPSPATRAPSCDNDDDHIETPVGQPCLLCDVPIVAGDGGTLMAARDETSGCWVPGPVHRECSLREVLGGAGHLAAAPHSPGTCNPDGGLPRYRSALLVQSWVDRMGLEKVLRAGQYKRVRDQLQHEIEVALTEELLRGGERAER